MFNSLKTQGAVGRGKSLAPDFFSGFLHINGCGTSPPRGQVTTSGDIFVVTTGRRCYRHLMGRDQGCCSTAYNAQGGPVTGNCLAQKVQHVQAEKLLYTYQPSPTGGFLMAQLCQDKSSPMPSTQKTCLSHYQVRLGETLASGSSSPCQYPKTLVVVQSLSCVQLFVTVWTATHQTSLSFTISWNLLTHVH